MGILEVKETEISFKFVGICNSRKRSSQWKRKFYRKVVLVKTIKYLQSDYIGNIFINHKIKCTGRNRTIMSMRRRVFRLVSELVSNSCIVLPKALLREQFHLGNISLLALKSPVRNIRWKIKNISNVSQMERKCFDVYK